MKVKLKLILVNIFRSPFRSLLCFLIVFITTVVISLTTHIGDVTDNAFVKFVDQYPTVATISVKPIKAPDGTHAYTNDLLNLDHVSQLSKSNSAKAFNITLPAGVMAEDELIKNLPSDSIIYTTGPSIISNNEPIVVNAINNILLTEAFYSEESCIIAGRVFSEKEMRGGTRAIIISDYCAQKHQLSIGDKVTIKLESKNCYIAYHVVGIYKSSRGITYSYIPLQDYFRDRTLFSPSLAYLENNPTRFDSLFRIDFLLTSPAKSEDFINDALNNGLDSTKYDIVINDKPYKAVSSRLQTISLLSQTIRVSVLVVGSILFVFSVIFFSISRKREKFILNALGLKKKSVLTMFVLEFTSIALCAACVGIIFGSLASEFTVDIIETSYLNDAIEQANNKDEIIHQDIREKRSLTLYKPLKLSLTTDYKGITDYVYPINSTCSNDKTGIRYETFWSANRELLLIGLTKLTEDQFQDSASYDRSICAELHRMGGYTFACYVPDGSEYKIGDVIQIQAHTIGEHSLLIRQGDEYHYEDIETADIALIVIGKYKSDQFSEIVLPMKELELLCDYIGVSGNAFTTVRFDEER